MTKPPIGVRLCALLYFLIAATFVFLFSYTYLKVPMAILRRIVGISLGLLLGYSVFFIGKGILKGQSWARTLVIVVSIFTVAASIIGYICGKVITLNSTLYLIAVVIINLLVVRYLYTPTARKYFQKCNAVESTIRRIIAKYL